MSRLDAAKTKVQWAEKHFGDFKDIAFGRGSGTDTRRTTVVHYDLQRQPDARPAQIATPSRECRLAFGDAVHQLRSSLDHIVYALIHPLTTDQKVLRKVDFPIYINENLFEASKGVGHLQRLLTPAQFTEIEQAQPYKRNPAAPEDDWLWVLSELDNIDKHRTILVVDPSLMTKRLLADGTFSVVKHRLEAGAQIFDVPPPTPSEVKVEERTFVVVLAETGLRCDNTTVVKVWREMIASVKGVISNFESKGLIKLCHHTPLGCDGRSVG